MIKSTTKWHHAWRGLYARKVLWVNEVIHRNPEYWSGWKYYRWKGLDRIGNDEIFDTAAAALAAHPDEDQTE